MKRNFIYQRVIGKILRILTSGFSGQNFLGQSWIPWLFKTVSPKHRRGLALKLMGVSPHYFIYQWSGKYPSTMSHREILEAEYRRNLSSRKEISEKILRPHLSPEMRALDFGCGPGYLAKEVAKHCQEVFAVDISCGIIACAKELNDSENIYYFTDNKRLPMIKDSSVDLIYSFAVIQHLYDNLLEQTLEDFYRVLAPEGTVICHMALSGENQDAPERQEQSVVENLRKKFREHYVRRSAENLTQKILDKGFLRPDIIPVSETGGINDTISQQHLFVFGKQP